MADYVKQQCEGMLCHGIEAVLRHVADRYALFFCISYIDMVEASASRDNQFQARKMVDDLLIDLGVDESKTSKINLIEELESGEIIEIK